MIGIEDIRKKKMEDIQQQISEQQELQQQIQSIENLSKSWLTKEALERFGNLKQAHEQTAFQFALIIAKMVQNNQIKEKVDDKTMREILIQMQPEKRDTKIRRI
ncbi:MAG: DNA-binding protein [Nanoarchaeota archaeon]